jgi:hypothetical protein
MHGVYESGIYDHNLLFYEQVTPGVLGERPVNIKI